MGQILALQSVEKLNKYFNYPVNVSTQEAVLNADVGAELPLELKKIDLNGIGFIKMFISETEGTNPIPTFDITANYYTPDGNLIRSAKIEVAELKAGKRTEVYINNDSLALSQGARYCDLSFTLPHSGNDYSVECYFEMGMVEEKNENVFTPKWDELFSGSAVSGGTVDFRGNINAAGGLSLLVGAVGATAPGDDITFSFYLDREQTMQYGSDVVVTIPTATDGTSDSIAVNFSDFDKVQSYKATGTISSTASLTDLRLYLVKTQLV